MHNEKELDALEARTNGLAMSNGSVKNADELFAQAREASALSAQVAVLAEALGRAIEHIPLPPPESYLYRKSYADQLAAEFRAALSTDAQAAGAVLAALRALVSDLAADDLTHRERIAELEADAAERSAPPSCEKGGALTWAPNPGYRTALEREADAAREKGGEHGK